MKEKIKGIRKLLAFAIYLGFIYAPLLEFAFLPESVIAAYGAALAGIYVTYAGACTYGLKVFFEKNIEEHKENKTT